MAPLHRHLRWPLPPLLPMPFLDITFFILFPLIFAIYWLLPTKWPHCRNLWLILVSYLLYMNLKPAYALVLFFVTLITYIGGIQLDKEESRTVARKKLAWLFALIGLFPLLIFKYYNFLNSSLSEALSAMGLQFAMPGLNWAIPIGISFYTFQAVGYMLDVYHRRTSAEKNLLDYILFVSFFPQVMSGPISKSVELLPQIKAPHIFNYDQAKTGLKLLLWGMFLKLVVADRLGIFVDAVYDNYMYYSGGTLFVASLFYSIQIYCDFAGYSLMAIGTARTLGFNLIDNFRRPYFAISVTDFWKRWHISLTRWLKQQIYIPLGGSHCSKPRTYWNIFITFLVSGIWHGANWTFIVWGCMHGLFLIVERHLGLQQSEANNILTKSCRIIVTFLLVNFAWIFFRMPSLSEAWGVISTMLSDPGVPNLSYMTIATKWMLFAGLLILLLKELRDEYFMNQFTFLNTKVVRWTVYLLLFCMILNFGVLDGGSFIYVSF